MIETSEACARFSRCRRWRTLLWRRWNRAAPVANFLMLNPSTADEAQLDPSCTRARVYAERWGFGGLIVTNLFAWRATDPGDMKSVADPVGHGNDDAIIAAAREASLLVCAWGNHGTYLGRSVRVVAFLRRARIDLHVLKMNGGGEPAHPLYLRGSLRPQLWTAR
jgi:hypothetical protein